MASRAGAVLTSKTRTELRFTKNNDEDKNKRAMRIENHKRTEGGPSTICGKD